MKRENKKAQISVKVFWKIWKWVEIKCDNLMEGGGKREIESVKRP